MSIDLAKKNFVVLKKEASDVIDSVGLGNQKARVGLALDISASMSNRFSNGSVQSVVEKLLALGVKFDDNQAIDIFLFGRDNYEVGELQESDFYEYVSRKITPKYSLEGSTNYAGVMKRIVAKYATNPQQQEAKGIFGGLFGKKSATVTATAADPAYVMFVTDGDNQDKTEAEAVIRAASNQGIFWQFVGIGDSSFHFLQQLDNLKGRTIDNANFFFFSLNDIRTVTDRDLFSRLMAEFPEWIKQARSHNFIK